MNSNIARQTERPSIYTDGAKVKTRQTRAVIAEEEYTSTLSSIISRDYYPAIPSLRRDAGILRKRAEGDISGAVAIRRAARKLAMHEEALVEQEIENETEAALLHGGIRKHARPLDRETIEGFHARVTSEDNAEFESVMTREQKDKRERMAIIYNTSGSEAKDVTLLLANHRSCDNEHAQQRSEGRKLDETPLMASDHFNEKVERTHAPGTTRDGKNISDYNSLFFTPQHYPSSQSRAIPNAPNSTILDQSIDDRYFDGMPPPAPINNVRQIKPAVVPSKRTLQSQEQWDIKSHDKTIQEPSNHAHLVEYIAKAPSLSSEKRIVPLNTRLPYQNESRLVTSSSQMATSADNIHAKPIYETDATTDLDASPRPLGVERVAREQLLKRKRNNYVAMTPLIIPGQGGRDSAGREDDDSPIVTWGNVASTPLVIGGHDLSVSACSMVGSRDSQDEESAGQTSCQSFTLPGEDTTENVARVASQNLAGQSRRCKEGGRAGIHRQVSTSVRNKKSSSTFNSRNATNISLLERTNSLTPAAKSLLQKCTNNSMIRFPSSTRLMSSNISARSSSALGSALRVSYTPKTSRHRSKSRSSANMKSTVQKATPLLSPKRENIESSGLVIPEKHGQDVRRSVGGKSCDDITGGLLKL